MEMPTDVFLFLEFGSLAAAPVGEQSVTEAYGAMHKRLIVPFWVASIYSSSPFPFESFLFFACWFPFSREFFLFLETCLPLLSSSKASAKLAILGLCNSRA